MTILCRLETWLFNQAVKYDSVRLLKMWDVLSRVLYRLEGEQQ
jgi:hypothetical protein